MASRQGQSGSGRQTGTEGLLRGAREHADYRPSAPSPDVPAAPVVGAVAAIREAGPVEYDSLRMGPTPVDEMDPRWASRAIDAGHTNADEPRVHAALEDQAG